MLIYCILSSSSCSQIIKTVAAGFDKNGTAIRGLFDMGFSFVSRDLSLLFLVHQLDVH